MAASSKPEPEPEPERNWSYLPYDLVGKIISHFRSTGDRLRSAAVCSDWKRAAAQTGKISHPPWLLLPRDPTIFNISTTTTATESTPPPQVLYSLSERKLYPVVSPLIDLGQQQKHKRRRGRAGRGREAKKKKKEAEEEEKKEKKKMRCVGSGEGWMITVSEFTADLQLHDLVTNSVTPLPPLSSFPDVDKAFSSKGRLIGYEFGPDLVEKRLVGSPFQHLEDVHLFYDKAVFFPSHSLVFLICADHCCLAFARIGEDSSWTVSTPEVKPFLLSDPWFKAQRYLNENRFLELWDVVFHKGHFYVITSFGWMMEILINPSSSSSAAPPTCKPLPLEPPSPDKMNPPLYFVEVEDELMLVMREPNGNLFTIHKFSSSPPHPQYQWVQVKSLGEWVLFLGIACLLWLSLQRNSLN